MARLTIKQGSNGGCTMYLDGEELGAGKEVELKAEALLGVDGVLYSAADLSDLGVSEYGASLMAAEDATEAQGTLELAPMRSIELLVDIPELAQDANAVVHVEDAAIETAGFDIEENLVATVLDGGMHTAVFIGECQVEDTDTIRIKFGNNTALSAGPFTDVRILFSQIPRVA